MCGDKKRVIKRTFEGRILKLNVDNNGYLHVRLFEDNKVKLFKVHNLVATVFLDNKDMIVTHKDGNKKNNAVQNLKLMNKEDFHSKKNRIRKKYKCIQTNEEFYFFKKFCTKYNLKFSKYYFQKALQQNTGYHYCDKFTFEEIL